MSYGWYPFAVDLTRVEGAFGCRDEALLAEASGRFDFTFDEAEDDPDDDEYDAKAVRDFIAGRVPRGDPGAFCGYEGTAQIAAKISLAHVGKLVVACPVAEGDSRRARLKVLEDQEFGPRRPAAWSWPVWCRTEFPP